MDVTGAGALFRLAAGDDKQHPASEFTGIVRGKGGNIDALVQALSEANAPQPRPLLVFFTLRSPFFRWRDAWGCFDYLADSFGFDDRNGAF